MQAAVQTTGSSPPTAEDEDEFTGGLFDEDGGGSAWEAAAPQLTPKLAPKPAQPKKGRKGVLQLASNLFMLWIPQHFKGQQHCLGTCSPAADFPAGSKAGAGKEAQARCSMTAPHVCYCIEYEHD